MRMRVFSRYDFKDFADHLMVHRSVIALEPRLHPATYTLIKNCVIGESIAKLGLVT